MTTDPKKDKEPNIITLTEKELRDAEKNPSILSNPGGFMNFTKNKNDDKGIADLVKNKGITFKGYVEDARNNIDTSEYADYLFPEIKGSYVFPFEADYNKARALNQSAGEQAGRTAKKLLPKIGLEFIGMLGNTLDVEDYVNAETNGEVGNWLNNWAQEQKANLDKNNPVYRVNPGEALDIGDSAWWFESGSSLVESATAFVGLGYLTGGGALAALKNGGKALEFLGAIGKGARAADAAKKGTRVAAGLANTLMLNQAEGVGIATNVFKDTFDSEFEKLTSEGLSEEEATQKAKMKASKDAASVISFNRVNMLLNATSSFAFLRSPALTRELIKNPSITISAKRTIAEGFQETGEELVNLIAEEQAGRDTYDFNEAFNAIATKEGVEAGLLGFIGGAGQTMLTNAGRELKFGKNNEGNRQSRNDAQRERYAKQQEAVSKWNQLSKEKKLANSSDAFFKAKESFLIYSQIEELSQKYKDNKNPDDLQKIQTLKNKLLSNQAYDAFSTGTTEQLIDVFEGISNISKQEAEKKGLDVNTYVQDSKDAISKIERLEKEYNKASSYVNSTDVYSNRAIDVYLKESKKETEASLKEIEEEVLEDFNSLGIADEDIETINEKDIINIKNYSSLSDDIKKAVNSLESYKVYKNLNKRKTALNKSIKTNALSYANLISDEKQSEIKREIKNYNNKKAEEVVNEQTIKNQEENATNNAETVKKFEEETTVEPQEEPEESEEVVEEPSNEKYFDYDLANDTTSNGKLLQTLENEDNKAYFDTNKSTQDKIKFFESKLERTKNIPEEFRDKFVLQYNKVLDELNTKLESETTEANNVAIAEEEANNKLNAVIEAIEADKSPKRSQTDKITEKITLFNDLLDSLQKTNVRIDNFKDVALYANERLGADRFQESFRDFRAVYNLTRRGIASDLTYADIFFDDNQKKNIVEEAKNTKTETLLHDFYNLTDLEYRAKVEEDLKDYIEKQNYKVQSSDTGKIKGFRIVEGFNKIAYLAKEYVNKVTAKKTRKFNILDFEIAKEDLNDQLNQNVDQKLIDYSEIKEGEEIEFVLLDKVVFSDGSIAYKNGNIEKDGITEENEAVEMAPIGIIHNNKLLKGAFLHTTNWINSNNIADPTDVDRQVKELTKIRQAVLDSENGRVKTTIKAREDGKLMFSPDGELKSTKENLPNVKIAVGKDQLLYTSKSNGEVLNNDRPPYILDGGVYAVFPVNNNADYAALLQPVSLSEKEAVKKSIANAVELFLNQNPKDPRVLDLFNQTEIDITKITGLKQYLSKFLYLNDNIKYTFGHFKTFLKGVNEDTAVVRIVDDRLEFGIGLNVGDTIRSVSLKQLQSDANSQDTIKGLVHKFEKVLDSSRLNIKKDLLGKEFKLPIITKDSVKTDTLNYNDFVKENTLTSQYSVTLENGKEIYTVQSNLEFDTSFVGDKKISKEIQDEAIGKEDNKKEVQQKIKFGNSTIEITDFDVDDMSPLRARDNQVEYNLKAVNILSSDKAKQVFEKGKKNGWDLNKILTELQVPKEQKQIILDKRVENNIKDSNNTEDFNHKTILKDLGLNELLDINTPVIISAEEGLLTSEHGKAQGIRARYNEGFLKGTSSITLSKDATLEVLVHELLHEFFNSKNKTDRNEAFAKSIFNALGKIAKKDSWLSRVSNTYGKESYNESSEELAILYLTSKEFRDSLPEPIKNKIEKWLTENNIVSQQQLENYLSKDLTKKINEGTTQNNLREEIITSLLADNSFVIEVNTATDITKEIEGWTEEYRELTDFNLEGNNFKYVANSTVENPFAAGGTYYKNNKKVDYEIYNAAFEEYVKGGKKTNTQYYSNLSAPGNTKGQNKYENDPDWEYQELEIATPDITPNIKGHAQFSTNKGIGWARVWYNKKTGVVEVQEIQSDLFQKGRGKKDLITYDSGLDADLYRENFDSIEEMKEYEKTAGMNDNSSNSNKFLQLLNKKNNWVNFFIESIIQDSAKKGYEKVLFPKGDTAAKIEGHETLEEFKEQKEARIKELEEKGDEYYDNEYDMAEMSLPEEVTRKDYIQSNLKRQQKEIETLKQELADVESGQTKLSSIAEFYENTVTNILNKKYKGNTTDIIDEYDNGWTELGLSNIEDFGIDLSPKQLSRQQEDNIEETTPNTLSVQGVSLKVQNIIVDSIMHNIINDAVSTDNKETAIDYVADFENTLNNVVVPAYQDMLNNSLDENERLANFKRLELVQNIIKSYPTIKEIIYNKLLTINNLKVNEKAIELLKNNNSESEALGEINNEESNNEEDTKDNTKSWSDYGVFMEDFRDKMGIELRNYLGSIEDVEGFKYNENGLREAITKTSPLLNLVVPVPLDVVINEVANILAFDGYNYIEPDFNLMMDELEKYVEVKPFLHNVIAKLNKADDKIKNRFVSVMHKHNTNHVYLYKKDNTKVYLSKSDNKSIVKNVHNSWYNNIMNSPLIEVVDSNYIVNSEVVNDINKKVDNLLADIKNKSYSVDKAKELLDLMGFRFSEDTINKIQQGRIRYAKSPYSLLHLFKNSDGAFKIYLQNLNNAKGKNIDEVELFSKDEAIYKFTRALTAVDTSNYASSFRDVAGNLYHSYSPNKFLTDRVKEIKSNTNLIKKLKDQAFTKNSLWLNQKIDNPELFNKIFNYFTIDGLSIKGGANKKIKDLTEGEYEEFKINLFFSNVNPERDNYIINTFYPTTSDKSVQYGLTNIGRKWSNSFIPGTKRMSDKAIDDLYKLIVEPEVSRILQVQKNPDLQNIKGYKEGGMLFNIIPTLNNIKELREDNFELKADIKTNPALQLLIKEELRKFIGKLANDKIKKWKSYGFVTEVDEEIINGRNVTYKKKKLLSYTNRPLVDEALDYTINYLVSNVNVYQMFTTDPAFYWKSSHWKTVAKNNYEKLGFDTVEDLKNDLNSSNPSINRDSVLKYYAPVQEDNGVFYNDFIVEHEDLFNNLGKRLGADVGPGLDFNNSDTDTFKLGVIKDNVKESYLVDYYKGLLENEAGDYFKVNSTDAQEFTTLKEHLYVMHKEGKITKKEMTDLLYKDNNEMPFSKDEMQIIFQPVKPLFVNNIWNNGVEHRVYIKSSSFPLFKQLTKGLEIDKLRKAMVSQGYDRVAFESAVKVGGVTNPTELYKDDKGNVNDKISIQGINNGESISRKGFRIQQEVPYKNKLEINDGSQQRKLLTSLIRNISGFKIKGEEKEVTGQEVQDRIDAIYHKIYKQQFNDLIEEIGFDIETNTIKNLEVLERILKDEALTREYSLYDLEALNLNEDKTDFAVPLWVTGVSSKIESMLNSIVDNRIRKIKVKGQSFVLGTSEGFKPVLEGDAATEYIKNNTNLVLDKDWVNNSGGVLRPMRIENGEVQAAEVMISNKLQDSEGNWINLEDYTDANGFLDTTKLNPEVLEIFGFRIPTQNLNSMSYIKIVGFLPEKSGDLILAPSEWTVQMGSDFDVDKLYANLFHIEVTGDNYLDVYQGDNDRKNLENELMQLHKTVLMHKDVQKEIVRPLTFGKLLSLGDEIYRYTKDQTDGRGASEEYQTYKYHNGKAGKAGTGVFSVDSVFNTSLQGKNIYLRTFESEEGKTIEREIVVKIGGKTSNRLSDPNTNTNNGNTKAKVIEAFQSLSVDNENEQGLHKLNINSHTFEAIKAMIFMGFEEDIIAYVINQPIVRRFTQLSQLEKDSITEFTEKEKIEKIDVEFPITDIQGIENGSYDEITMKALKEGIQSKEPNTNYQQRILKTFNMLSEYGLAIKNLQSTINAERAGLGKNLFYSTQKETQVLELPLKRNFANVDRLIGDFVTFKTTQGQQYTNASDDAAVDSLAEEWFNDPSNARKKQIVQELMDMDYYPLTNIKNGNRYARTIKFVRPTNISGFGSTYALLTNNKMWNTFYPYNNEKLKNLFKEINNNNEESLGLKAAANKKIFDNIKNFVMSGAVSQITDDVLEAERKRLFMTTKNNDSLGLIIKTLISEGKLSNPFINRLTITLKKEVLPATIEYASNLAEALDERAIYASIVDMLKDNKKDLGTFNGIKYTPRVVAQDLITYSIINGGVQGANNFVKYIPLNYLKELGLYDYIKELSFYNEDDFNTNNFKNQYLQHNPKRVLLGDTRKEWINGKKYKYLNDKTVIRRINSEDDFLPSTFSIYSEALKKHRLYSYDNNSKQWVERDVLGNKDIIEYDSTKEWGTSIIKLNQVIKPKTVTVPQGSKASKNTLKLTDRVEAPKKVIYDPQAVSLNDEYQLDNNDMSSVSKMSYILDKIISNNTNPLNTIFAKELLANIDKISEYQFLIDNTINAEGLYSYKNKTIKVNIKEANTKQLFEDTFLEEVIHAFTKKSILTNANNEVLKVKALREEAENKVRNYLGEKADVKIKTVRDKLNTGGSLTDEEYDIIYPILNTEEFVARLFKSKRLQKILNNDSEVLDEKSFLAKVLDFIRNLFTSNGIDIKKGSTLEYSLVNSIALIKQKAPASSITGELKKIKPVNRTPDFIYNRFNLLDSNGEVKTLTKDNADKIAKWVTENTTNLVATNVNNKVVISQRRKVRSKKKSDEGNQLDIFKQQERQERIEYLMNTKFNILESVDDVDSIPEIVIMENMPKITTESAEKQTGLKVGTTQDINPFWISKDGVSVEKAAESLVPLVEQGLLPSLYEDDYYITDVIIEILSKNSKTDVIEYFTRAEELKEIDRELKELGYSEEDDFSPKKQTKASNVRQSLDNRIRNIKDNIDKARAREDFAKVAQLQEQLKVLKDKKNKSLVSERLSQIVKIGEQDMEELEEMFNNKVSLEDALYIRKVIHYWKRAVDTLFEDDDRESEDLLNSYKAVETRAIIFEDKLIKIENDYMEQILKESGNMTTVEDIFYHFKDINGLQAMTMDISRSNNALLDSAFLLVKNANIDTIDEKNKLLNRLSGLENKLKNKLKNTAANPDELYEVFRQKTKNGKLTGHLVNRYSVEFIKNLRRLTGRIYNDPSVEAHTKILDFAKKNIKDINLNYLFPKTKLEAKEKKKAEDYKKALKEELGTNHYNELISEQKVLLKNYENNRKGYLEYSMENYKVGSIQELFNIKEAYERYLNWIMLNSPYQFYSQIQRGVPNKVENYTGFNSSKYVKFVPNNDNQYDNNFKAIESDETLFEFYNYFTDIDKELKSYLSTEDRSNLAMEGIPYVDKTLLDQYKDKGMKAGLAPLWDGLKDSIRVNEDGIVDNSIKDPVTGEKEKRLSANLSANNSIAFKDYVNKKAIEYKVKTGKDASDSQIAKWKEEIIDTLAQKKSYDLPKVLRIYALTALGYKHKAKVEDSLKLIQNVFNEQKEFERNSRGVIKTDKGSNPKVKNPENSYLNTKKQLDYFMQVYYGKKRVDEGVRKNKVLTSDELTTKKEVDLVIKDLEVKRDNGTINDDDYQSMMDALNNIKANLGGVAVNSRVGDGLLKWVQMKGMGWNILSSFANLGFGYISNRLEAVGGQLYSKKDLTKAYGLVRSSILKNATFNNVETDTARKIRKLMDRFDVLKTSVNELYSSPLSVDLGKNYKWLSTYNIVERAEYVNQAPIMIALMMNSKIEVNGEERNLWEGFDNDGNWKKEFGEYPKKEISKLRIKIDQNNKMNHGNYDPDSPIAGKNKFLGRALLQFRSWMLEGVAVRFEGRKPDAALGIVRKGRYVSLVDFYKTAGFTKGSLDILKGFARSVSGELLFKGSNFESYADKGLEEVDIANMRKVMAELVMLLGLHSTYYILAMAAAGMDDEEDSFKVYAINNLLNQNSRLQTDIVFYYNPNELKKLIKDPLPLLSIITDTLGFIDASYRFIQGDDEIKSGVYSGHSRVLRETSQMLPLGTQVYKNINYSIQTFEK